MYVEFFSSVWHTLQSQSLGRRRMSIIQVSCWKKFWGTEHGAHTHSVIKTNQLMLTKDVVPVLRMRENFLIHSLGKYKDFLIFA